LLKRGKDENHTIIQVVDQKKKSSIEGDRVWGFVFALSWKTRRHEVAFRHVTTGQFGEEHSNNRGALYYDTPLTGGGGREEGKEILGDCLSKKKVVWGA